ncbi:uncharacterized protein LOC107612275 [Arachis ipaensis]|uniref:uncharacterized protein LOC107612275 n=1 Tax=Arachis ipaensis TaxID=130454 RepID=UPI000A2B675A|nr:uncharacterized protein LOC107612275 [Arachis ipaensis]
MSSNKKGIMRTILLSSNGGCGCGKQKPSEVHQPAPKPKISVYQTTNPSTSSTTSGDPADDEDFTSTTISDTDTHHQDYSNNNKGIIAKNNNGFQVFNASNDPSKRDLLRIGSSRASTMLSGAEFAMSAPNHCSSIHGDL